MSGFAFSSPGPHLPEGEGVTHIFSIFRICSKTGNLRPLAMADLPQVRLRLGRLDATAGSAGFFP